MDPSTNHLRKAAPSTKVLWLPTCCPKLGIKKLTCCHKTAVMPRNDRQQGRIGALITDVGRKGQQATHLRNAPKICREQGNVYFGPLHLGPIIAGEKLNNSPTWSWPGAVRINLALIGLNIMLSAQKKNKKNTKKKETEISNANQKGTGWETEFGQDRQWEWNLCWNSDKTRQMWYVFGCHGVGLNQRFPCNCRKKMSYTKEVEWAKRCRYACESKEQTLK